MRTKEILKVYDEKKHKQLDFSFSLFYSPFFFVLIPFFHLVAGLSLDFIYEVKVSHKTLKTIKFFKKEMASDSKNRFSFDFASHI